MKSRIKLITIYLLRGFMYLLYIFPIKRNRIVFNAYRGSQYSCNPKYISEYLINNYPGKYDIIWLFNEPRNFLKLKDKGYKLVKFVSLQRFFYEATCKISVNNVGSFSWFPLRKGQEHVNTWHGGAGLKKCGIDEIANDKIMKKTIQMSGNNTTLILSTSQKYTKYVCQDDLGYYGNVLKSGYPRNDIIFQKKFFEKRIRVKVCDLYNVNHNAYIVLYAPTWRYDTSFALKHPNFFKMKKILEKRVNKPVYFLSRLHHLSEYKEDNPEFVKNATNYEDMQELLCIADLLITDYSSSIWDFSITKNPIILFAPDIETYEIDRGLHEPINNWGFPVCKNDNEIEEVLMHTTDEEFEQNAVAFLSNSKSYENGNACKIFAQWINKICS